MVVRVKAPLRDRRTRCHRAPPPPNRVWLYALDMPGFGSNHSQRVLIVAVTALALILSIAGCASTGASFSPNGPCLADGRQAGAYPDLEGRLPRQFEGKAPDRLDSGRNCSDANLDTLKAHGVHELRFAGGLWQLAPETGVTMAVFSAPGLQADWLGEFYEAGARAASKVSNLTVSHPTLRGSAAVRMDYRDGQSPQTIVVWSAGPDIVHVVLTAGLPDRLVQEAINSFS